MSSNLDLKAITEQFFAAYDDHDVDGIIWRGLLGAVPDFGVEVVEMIQGEGNIVVVQALLGGAMPADVPGLVTKGKSDRIAHAYIIRYSAEGKIMRLDCYWDNTAINAIKASVL
jgi:hypothetical protein